MAIFLGIPIWMWAVGGGLVGSAVIVDQAGDAAEQVGDAAEQTANLTKWLIVAGGLYVSYAALKSAGAIK